MLRNKEKKATELRNKIDSLSAILKSSTLGINKPEGKKKGTRKKIQKGGQQKSKSQAKTIQKGDKGKVSPLQLL